MRTTEQSWFETGRDDAFWHHNLIKSRKETPRYDPRFGLETDPFDINDLQNSYLPSPWSDRNSMQYQTQPYNIIQHGQQPTIVIQQIPQPIQVPPSQVPPSQPSQAQPQGSSGLPGIIMALFLILGFLAYFQVNTLYAQLDEKNRTIERLLHQNSEQIQTELTQETTPTPSRKPGTRMRSAKNTDK